ncbi:cobalt-zinc-cadmium resistance protein/cation efflux system protein [Buttiauxella ferragutiae ATCC 51602]|uniref:Cobalt-zinc-cadmium resistance protein/cation efflux system protein n=1 Tax=Buttiauxella ferragutiae ATCC 51602 TaxID=1354252 RepID=A0ABX2WBA4_9ENTR|nr:MULTISPECIES: CusA/CzcA family heavy metal efflux RND transporter [Buttiauxella]OAT30116.1 cobalt-zinc-cadmium resistance protein/cation efflux system protein [Buttiauxella ferragutiae ATCC 51602]
MLGSLINLSLKYKLLIIVLFMAVVGYGVMAFRSVPVDAFPDVTPVQVNVYTEASGLAAEDIEKLFTVPVESNMAGLPNVEQIRSMSLAGLSYISINFKDNTDIYLARQWVSEKLQEIGDSLPAGYSPPVLGANSSGLGQVFWYTLDAGNSGLSTMELRSLQEWTIRMILKTVPGVDDVVSWGGNEKQYQVTLDPEKMALYNITLADVLPVLAGNNRQAGGQSVNIGEEQYLVRGYGQLESLSDIAGLRITSAGNHPVYIRDIAKVEFTPAVRAGAVTQNGQEVVMGMVLSRINENASDVVNGVKDKISTVVNSLLPEGVTLKTVYDRTNLVDLALKTAQSALLEGALLVAIVLFLFLGELRSALIVIITLPGSMLIAFILMQQFGLSANLMSLAGLAIGTGMMVDGAVVMVENIHRRLALNHASGAKNSFALQIQEAAREVAIPVAFAILIIVVVFTPLLTLDGLEGKLFRPMALTIIFAMLGSLILSLTIVPVLSSLLLKPAHENETRIVRWITAGYQPLLNKVLSRRKATISIALTAFLFSLALFPFLGKSFMPQLQEGSLMFRITSIPSTSLDSTLALSRKVSDDIRGQFPEVKDVVATIGRAEKGETADVNSMEVLLTMNPRENWPEDISYDQLARNIQAVLEEKHPGALFSATQPIQMRVDELISGIRATLALKIYGPDSATLDSLSQQIQATLNKIPGVEELSTESSKGKPQVIIRVDREKAAGYGINTSDIMDVVESGIGGASISSIIEGTARFDLVTRFSAPYRESVSAISAIPLRGASGQLISLSQVADIELAEGYAFLRREGLQRYVVLQMEVEGRDIDGFVKEASQAIEKNNPLPEGYWSTWGGAFENQQRAMGKLSVILPLTIGLIFILLYTAFGTLRHATLIIANVPFAMTGGILSLFLSGQYMSVPSSVGFIAVFGVSMLNGIVMVSFFNELRQQGASIRDAVRLGAVQRLRPVLITATVAILGLIPMLLSSGVGAEVQRPLATVVVGGLLTSTALTLFLLPLLYEMTENWHMKRNAAAQKELDAQ